MQISELFAIMPEYTVVLMVVVAFVGAVFGSFINCVAWRLVAGESPWKGRSHCAVCNHPLGVLDLVPIFSWLFLRGKCRYCGEHVSARYLIAELICALYFASVVLVFGFTIKALALLVVGCCLLGLSLVDMETFIIPNGFVIVVIGVWIVYVAALAATGGDWVAVVLDGLLGAVAIAGVVWALSALMERILQRAAMGFGDIKLLFAVGLFLGFGAALLNLIVACVVGIVFGLLAPTPDPSLLEDENKDADESVGADEVEARGEDADEGKDEVEHAGVDADESVDANEAEAKGEGADEGESEVKDADEGGDAEADEAVTESRGRKPFPFGPSIALATWFSLLFGSQIVSWYLGLFM